MKRERSGAWASGSEWNAKEVMRYREVDERLAVGNPWSQRADGRTFFTASDSDFCASNR